ncbi:hypothetical protein ACRRTK_005157 [Alexandromys fortis]
MNLCLPGVHFAPSEPICFQYFAQVTKFLPHLPVMCSSVTGRLPSLLSLVLCVA